MSQKLIIYTDGGARGNPGPAGIGAVLKNEKNEIITEISEYLGVATNNQAEYKAVIAALKKAKTIKEVEVLECFLDSELIVKQLSGEYKVKNQGLIPLFIEIRRLVKNFKKVSFTHVKRELNKDADRLANLAMDSQLITN